MNCVISFDAPKCDRCTTGKRTCLWKGKSRHQWYEVKSSGKSAPEVVDLESEEDDKPRKRRRFGSLGTFCPFYAFAS
jgi:hypothetical protein